MLHAILNVFNFHNKYTKMRSGDNAVKALLFSLNTVIKTITFIYCGLVSYSEIVKDRKIALEQSS